MSTVVNVTSKQLVRIMKRSFTPVGFGAVVTLVQRTAEETTTHTSC